MRLHKFINAANLISTPRTWFIKYKIYKPQKSSTNIYVAKTAENVVNRFESLNISFRLNTRHYKISEPKYLINVYNQLLSRTHVEK